MASESYNMKAIGKLCEGKPRAQFDEGTLETEILVRSSETLARKGRNGQSSQDRRYPPRLRPTLPVFIFDLKHEAENFRGELKTHLNKYGLHLNEDKSGLIHFGKTKGNVFQFLGFTFYWSKDHTATRRVSLRVKTARATLFKKIQDFQVWIKDVRSRMSLNDIWRIAAAKLRGHYNYYGVLTNRPKLNHYYHAAIGSLFKWLNRRSQRKSFTWDRFAQRLRNHPLPLPPPVAVLHKLVERRSYAY